MKNALYLLVILFALKPSSALAIFYYQNKGGTLTKIDETAFLKCNKIIFRAAGKNELPVNLKRKVLNALLRGDAINDSAAASSELKKMELGCSYSDKDDLS